MKQKAFFIIFKRAFNEANNTIFLEGEIGEELITREVYGS